MAQHEEALPATERQERDLLTQIASRYMGVETLETRLTGALDFHELNVWQIKHALQAAFDAGRACRAPAAR